MATKAAQAARPDPRNAPAAKKAAPKKDGESSSREIANWDEALAARAKAQSKVAKAASGGGNFISFKGGHMAYKGAAVADDALDVIVLDSVIENAFYEGDYDEGNPQSPLCYAFGRDPEEIAPHPDVVEAGTAQADRCADCEHNQWGSAAKGRGKACKNTFRLGMIVADEATSAKAIKEAEVVYAKTPVTSGKNWGNYVRQCDAVNKPPLAFVTEMSVQPAAKQFAVVFVQKEKVSGGEVIKALLAKADEVEKVIDFPYPKFEEKPKPAARGRAPVVKRGAAPAKKAASRKY